MPQTQVLYRLADEQRHLLKKPLGEVVDEDGLMRLERSGRLGRPLVSVGDMVCDTLLRLGLEPQVLIFDLITMRGPVPDAVATRLTTHASPLVKVKNPAATITRQLDEAVKTALQAGRTTRIQVDGEEDLAGLPAIMHAPEGATMIYGMPNQGLVPVPVTKRSREQAGTILSLMKVGPRTDPLGPTEGG